ncbi:UspA domain-containing protein [Candidatus Magnetomoraceae bacterium gMMP-1]
MQKKIMLAVDDSIHSKNAIKYAVKISSVVKNLSYTLFHVQPGISQFLLEDAQYNIKTKVKVKKIIDKNTEHSEQLLEKHKKRMVRMGIDEEHIEIATIPRSLGLAKDTLEFVQKGLYDAVVVGRRGLTRTQQAFIGSVTSKLVEHCKTIPVWVVDGEIKSNRIMLAVDGSESAFQAVDHLSFMIGENPEIKITLFHVMPRLTDYCEISFDQKEADNLQEFISQGDKKCINNFYAHAKKSFKDYGIKDDQIEIKAVERTMNIGKAIVDEAKNGNYGTVVIGRRGTNKAFFMGSVSKYVLDKTSDKTIWLVS